jgi:alkylhydroperoxidase family enzyme
MSKAITALNLPMVDPLLQHAGFSDRDIWDIATIAAFFNMTNRVAAATDMQPKDADHARAR